MIPTLRVLTRKSKLKFGKYKDYTVQELFDLEKKTVLISAYYKLTSIDFKENILDELRIIDDWIIPKPCKDIDMYYDFLNSNGYRLKIRTRYGSNALKKEEKPISKSMLQRINQNHLNRK